MAGALGGLKGVASILKTYLDRNNAKKVKFGDNGEVLETSGLSVNEVMHLLKAAEHEADH